MLRCLAVASLFCTSACVFRTPRSNFVAGPIERLNLDVTQNGRAVDPAVTAKVRSELNRAVSRSKAPSVAEPASLAVRVDLLEHRGLEDALAVDGCAAAGVVAVPFGIEFEHQRLAVDVTLERGGRTYSGHAAYVDDGSIYSSAEENALVHALDQALAAAR